MSKLTGLFEDQFHSRDRRLVQYWAFFRNGRLLTVSFAEAPHYELEHIDFVKEKAA